MILEKHDYSKEAPALEYFARTKREDRNNLFKGIVHFEVGVDVSIAKDSGTYNYGNGDCMKFCGTGDTIFVIGRDLGHKVVMPNSIKVRDILISKGLVESLLPMPSGKTIIFGSSKIEKTWKAAQKEIDSDPDNKRIDTFPRLVKTTNFTFTGSSC